VRVALTLPLVLITVSACDGNSSSNVAPRPRPPSVVSVVSSLRSMIAVDHEHLVGPVTIYYTTKRDIDILSGNDSPTKAPHDSTPGVIAFATCYVGRAHATGVNIDRTRKSIAFFMSNGGLDTSDQVGPVHAPPAALPAGMGRPIVVDASSIAPQT
jgi:hypothetical protein